MKYCDLQLLRILIISAKCVLFIKEKQLTKLTFYITDYNNMIF